MASRKALREEFDNARQKARNIKDLMELLGRTGMSDEQYNQWQNELLVTEFRVAELKMILWQSRNIEGDEI